MITNLEQREIFHIAFLRQISSRLKPNLYAVKGGVNLRLFFGGIRYSEDMDIDVKGIEPFKLKDIVMDILGSKMLQTILRPFQIEKIVPPDITVAKQTDTMQRFKVHLITSAAETLFTKIEFSRRRLDASIKTEMIDETILRNYKLSPLLVSHYPAETAVVQKIHALAERTKTQARDIFDIYMLLGRVHDLKHLLNTIPNTVLKKAYNNIFNLDFSVFRDTVLNYLSETDRKIYNQETRWEDICLRISETLEV